MQHLNLSQDALHPRDYLIGCAFGVDPQRDAGVRRVLVSQERV
jgi:hypothetical protein